MVLHSIPTEEILHPPFKTCHLSNTLIKIVSKSTVRCAVCSRFSDRPF